MFDKFVDDNKENIINTLCDLIKFKSVSEENIPSSHPFGKECTKALETVLNIGKEMGFKTKNIDNYCGYIEFGEGKELVGIVGHLDVVPAKESDGWTTPPFTPSIRDNKIFGRGTIDDKGPVIASLYAMKAVFENAKINKRVRLILGLNEENGWKCIDRYKETEEIPNISFSPDSNFPAIYAEKGIISVELKHPFEIKDTEILNIDYNNNALNVVPKVCSITLKIKNETLFDNILNSSFANIEIQKLEDLTLKITSTGKAAHAARLGLGKNAITNLIKYLLLNFECSDYLKTIYDLGLFEIESPNFFTLENLEKYDSISNTKIEDESGILTSNIAVLDYIDCKLIIKINLRVPVKTPLTFIEEKYNLLKTILPGLEVYTLSKQEPLYLEKESFLVKTLVDIFNRKTGSNLEPIAIGGGTFARAFENSVAYGLVFPNEEDKCHQVDEYVNIDSLILGTKIYAEAIYELTK